MAFRTAICTAAIACAALAPDAVAAEPDATSGAELRAEATLSQAQDTLTEPTEADPRELTLVLAKLSQAIPDLDGRERRVANEILARPDDGPDDRYGDGFTVPEAPESPACSGQFCVHWVDTSQDMPDLTDTDTDGVPDYVEKVRQSAAKSFDRQNADLGWVDPIGDADRGGGPPNATDIYLLDIDRLYYGYASPDEHQGPIASKQAYLVLDDDYKRLDSPPEFTAIEAMKATMAHEYNHVLQFAYDSQEDLWMFESTATWMEDVVYPAIDDYLGYLPFYAANSRVPLTDNSDDGLKIYGTAVWNHFLADTSPDIVRDAWADSATTDRPHLSVAAYDSGLGGTGSPYASLSAAFADFAASTVEWRGESDIYDDATEFPNVRRSGKLRLNRSRTVKLDHLSYALIEIPAGAATDAPELRLKGPDGTYSSLGLYGRVGEPETGLVASSQSTAPDGGDASVVIAGGDYERVTALVANADASVKGAANEYRRDNQEYKLKLVPAQ